MNCNDVRDRLVEYLDGMIGEEGSRLARHLDDCECCQKEYRQLVDTIRMVREVELPDPGPEFWHEHRSVIKQAAIAQLEKGIVKRFFSRYPFNRLHRRPDRYLSPVLYPLSASLILLFVIIFGVVLSRVDPVEMNVPRGEVRLVFDEKQLGEVYVNGVLFRDFSSVDELNELSDRELGEVLHAMAVNLGFHLEGETGDIFQGGGDDLDVENEIERLDPGETMKLLELLEEIPVSS